MTAADQGKSIDETVQMVGFVPPRYAGGDAPKFLISFHEIPAIKL
ncbi:hypothetical protein ACQZ58_16510 [Rhizobium sp. 23-156Da]